VRLWDVRAGAARVLAEEVDPALALAFSRDGKLALAAHPDGTVRVWELATGKEPRAFQGHAGPVVAASFSPDAARVLMVSADYAAALVETASGATVREFRREGGRTHQAALGPDGARALVGNDDGTIELWDAPSGTSSRSLPGHADHIAITLAAWSADGRFALAGAAHQVQWIEVEAGTVRERIDLAGAGDEPLSLAFGPDGTWFLVGTERGVVLKFVGKEEETGK
jgi:WD40 repeat protein